MDSIASKLERQDRRRSRDLPTLSVLVGDLDLARKIWHSRGESLEWQPDEEPDLARAWLTRLLLSDVFEHWLSRQGALAELEPFEALTRLRSKGAPELEIFLPACPAFAIGLAPSDLSRLAAASRSPEETPDLVKGFSDEVVQALIGLPKQHELPSVSLDLGGLDPADWEPPLAKLSTLLGHSPQIPAAVMCSEEALDQWLAGSSGRLQAMIREGRIDFGRAPEIVSPGPGRGLVEALTRERQVLEAYDQAASDWRALESAAAGEGDLEAKEADSKARSAAEAFLFALLEAMPETRGLFELNGRIPLPGTPRVREIDLLSRPTKLAIEVDGYFHFQDAEAYRRDRRKDLALQRGGYLVLRFLAEDVVVRLETLLATIREALPARQRDVSRVH
ncbi:MAG: DUF559 domain-containing protein [Planctomycetota bacterium]